MDVVTDEKLNKYFAVTGQALAMAREARDGSAQADDCYDMARRYYNDAKHFFDQGEKVLALSALNYAHGWLDAGARIGLFKVSDSTLFTVDE